jgi:hypothetical protein
VQTLGANAGCKRREKNGQSERSDGKPETYLSASLREPVLIASAGTLPFDRARPLEGSWHRTRTERGKAWPGGQGGAYGTSRYAPLSLRRLRISYSCTIAWA